MDFKTQHFEGPLDLLLSMIQERKVEITKIALSDVTEQFIQIVEKMDESDVDDLADFLVIASKLVLLKSKHLLPHYFPEEEDEQDLADQLRLYKAFVDASRKLHKAWLSGKGSAFRDHPAPPGTEVHIPENLSAAELEASMIQLVDRLTPPKALPKVMIDRTVSMKEKIQLLREKLHKVNQLFFHEMLSERSTSEIVISFLAMLELVKQKHVEIHQDGVFTDIMIQRV